LVALLFDQRTASERRRYRIASGRRDSRAGTEQRILAVEASVPNAAFRLNGVLGGAQLPNASTRNTAKISNAATLGSLRRIASAFYCSALAICRLPRFLLGPLGNLPRLFGLTRCRLFLSGSGRPS
jgi:hypothetical protein